MATKEPVVETTPETKFEADAGPPDGGSRAWLVVVGGFLTYFVTFGLLNSFGTFQAYYGETLLPGRNASEISWIGSLQLFLLFIGGLVFGPIFDTKGSKILFIPGTLIFSLSLMMASLCREYYQFILAQSILFGIGDAMLFYPTISAIPHWFREKRGLAMGTVVAGSSLGGIAWPLIMERLFDVVGFPWTLRIVGFISLALLAPACFMVVPRLPPGKSGGVPKEDLIASLKDLRYWLTVAGMLFVMWGMFIPFYYIPLFAIDNGVDSTYANTLVSILNVGSFVGRIVSGALADKIGKFNMAIVCSLLSAALILLLHCIHTEGAITAFTFLYGFASGGLISLQSACVAQITKNMRIIGIMIGVMMAVCSLGALTGNPIGGALESTPSGTVPAWVDFAGVMMFAGTVLLVGARLLIDSGPLRAI
ncbi:MCT family MFS transporter [Aspergillus lucknowensis]|uniref:MFS general substrate transporter n=1 Tax=Aspergillus lucknowensis TaxID=176173 RepID=A0ABR4LWW7_9EURO